MQYFEKRGFGQSHTPQCPNDVDESSRTRRDYGREVLADPHVSDIVRAIKHLCALDESTCLHCLELDGRLDSPALPIHDGCRCVTVPVTKTWRELGVDLPEFPEGQRASAIGPVAGDGGLYKQYLIQRARGVADSLLGATLAENLRAWLKTVDLSDADRDVVASIRSQIISICPTEFPDEAASVLAGVRWNVPTHHHLFVACAKAEQYDTITKSIERMARDVPDGPYAGRHRAMLYKTAAEAVKSYSANAAVEYLTRAAELHDKNLAVLVKLGGFLRRTGKYTDARRAIQSALHLNPSHEAALRELERLGEGKDRD